MRAHHVRGFRLSAESVISAVIILVTALHGFSYLLSSYTASTPNVKTWWLLLGYQGAVAAFLVGAAYFKYRLSGKNTDISASCIARVIGDFGGFLPSLLILCCVGLLFHAYSKLALVNFHISNCIGELRNAWITTPHDQIPTYRRITSVIGHLLASLAYAGLFFSVYRFSIGVRKIASFAFASVFFLAGGVYAFFMGSQNAALALLVVTILAIGLGAISAPFSWRGSIGWLAIIAWFTLLAAFFSLFVFGNRVECGGASATLETYRQYEEAFFDEIPMRRKETVTEVSAQVRQACKACNAIFIYLNHGIYNFEHIVAQENLRGDPVFFAFFRGVAKRFGFPMEENPSKTRVYGLGGATLPGSAYHDFGFTGMVIVGVVQALLAILAGGLLRSGSLLWEGAGLVLYVVVGYVAALSMMFVGFNVISFPFITISMIFAMAGLIAWAKHSSNVRIRNRSGSEPMIACGGLDVHAPKLGCHISAVDVIEKQPASSIGEI